MKTKEEKLSKFWEYGINPITGFIDEPIEKDERLKIKRRYRNDLMKEELVSPAIDID